MGVKDFGCVKRRDILQYFNWKEGSARTGNITSVSELLSFSRAAGCKCGLIRVFSGSGRDSFKASSHPFFHASSEAGVRQSFRHQKGAYHAR